MRSTKPDRRGGLRRKSSWLEGIMKDATRPGKWFAWHFSCRRADRPDSLRALGRSADCARPNSSTISPSSPTKTSSRVWGSPPLLFDENLSRHLPRLLADVFSGSQAVLALRLGGATDGSIWDYARRENFVLVTKTKTFNDSALQLMCMDTTGGLSTCRWRCGQFVKNAMRRSRRTLTLQSAATSARSVPIVP